MRRDYPAHAPLPAKLRGVARRPGPPIAAIRAAALYSMYNVGPYTLAPLKVVWRRMDRRINAAVVEAIDDPLLGRRPVVPQETCVLTACDRPTRRIYSARCSTVGQLAN